MSFSMKIGPQTTNTAGFKGFGMKVGGSAAASSSGRPQGVLGGVANRGTAAAKAKAASGGLSALFRDSLEEEDVKKKKELSVPSWSKPTMEAVQAQRKADELRASDPTVFQYDEVIDDEKVAMNIELPSQQVRTAALEQKKKVGLVLREGVEACRAGNKRECKYIEKVMVTIDRRKVEQQIVEDRLLKKEQDAREGREVFVTEAFKEELKRRKKFEDELESQELRDQRKDATKMEDGQGFADFHRRLLNGGMSSSRGGEKVLEKAAPRVDLHVEEPEAKTEQKEEEVDEDDKKEPMKTEVGQEDAEPQHGVQDVQGPSADPGTKAAAKLAEQEQRAEKAMSAKERYLARKRKAEEAAA